MMKNYLKRAASALIAAAIVLGSAMLGGGTLVQRSFAEKSSSELKPEYENGYAYTVDNGEARIWYADNTVTGDVVIPSKLGGYPVTEVCISLPFVYELDITSAVIPSGVRTINRNAFSYCKKLTSVTIPDTVTLIEAFAFEETALTDIYYEGSESDWVQIEIQNNSSDGYNFELAEATVHYNTKIKGSDALDILDFGKDRIGQDSDSQTQDDGVDEETKIIVAVMMVIAFLVILIAFAVLWVVLPRDKNSKSSD